MIFDVDIRLTEVPTIDYAEYLSMMEEKFQMADKLKIIGS